MTDSFYSFFFLDKEFPFDTKCCFANTFFVLQSSASPKGSCSSLLTLKKVFNMSLSVPKCKREPLNHPFKELKLSHPFKELFYFISNKIIFTKYLVHDMC